MRETGKEEEGTESDHKRPVMRSERRSGLGGGERRACRAVGPRCEFAFTVLEFGPVVLVLGDYGVTEGVIHLGTLSKGHSLTQPSMENFIKTFISKYTGTKEGRPYRYLTVYFSRFRLNPVKKCKDPQRYAMKR